MDRIPPLSPKENDFAKALVKKFIEALCHVPVGATKVQTRPTRHRVDQTWRFKPPFMETLNLICQAKSNCCIGFSP